MLENWGVSLIAVMLRLLAVGPNMRDVFLLDRDVFWEEVKLGMLLEKGSWGSRDPLVMGGTPGDSRLPERACWHLGQASGCLLESPQGSNPMR